MKKTLLFAALTSLGLGAMAQANYVLEKVWEVNTALPEVTNDCRQGIGIDGKYYINDKGNQKVIVYDKNGLTTTEFAGGTNCGITADEAGNLIVSLATFPGSWNAETSMLRVIDTDDGTYKDFIIPEDALPLGRCDFLGKVTGDVYDFGSMAFVGDKSESTVSILVFSEGNIDTDMSFRMPIDGLTPTTSTIINCYPDESEEGENGGSMLYVTRNAWPVYINSSDGETAVTQTFTLPNKGACNGMDMFTFNGEKFVVYPTLANYLDGFAVAQMNAEEAIVTHEAEATVNANAFQCNWLNAEVDEDNNAVNIYQYYPGSHITMWKFYDSNAPKAEGKWIVLLDKDGNEVKRIELNEGQAQDSYITLTDIPYKLYGSEGNVASFYFIVDGVEYYADANGNTMAVLGDAMQNPLTDTTNWYYQVETGYSYSIGLQFKDGVWYAYVVRGLSTGVEEAMGNKTVASTRYFNMAGQEMTEANGVTIMVTTYTDGTTSSSKVVR